MHSAMDFLANVDPLDFIQIFAADRDRIFTGAIGAEGLGSAWSLSESSK